jgi:hypothetical protein
MWTFLSNLGSGNAWWRRAISNWTMGTYCWPSPRSIREYIQKQEAEDQRLDQLEIFAR